MTKPSEPAVPAVVVSEADIKRTIADFLEVGENQERWLFDRLNAGDFIETRGNSRRRIKGAKKGRADFVVYQAGQATANYRTIITSPSIPVCFVTFLEVKRVGGKQTPEQEEFEVKANAVHSRYFIVISLEDAIEALERR